MKSFPRHRFGVTRVLVLSAWMACGFLFARPDGARAADPTKNATDQAQMPTPALERRREERPNGPVFVAVPVAFVYGIGGGNAAYCSPSIRATNSSNAMIEELIIGIDYLSGAGKPAGRTITRFADIKVRRQDTHYFYQLDVSECTGLLGQVSVVRCVYATGRDCSSDVQAIGFGAIPLRLKPR